MASSKFLAAMALLPRALSSSAVDIVLPWAFDAVVRAEWRDLGIGLR